VPSIKARTLCSVLALVDRKGDAGAHKALPWRVHWAGVTSLPLLCQDG
jgi:hypothetical protein